MILQKIHQFIDSTLIDLGRQFRWSYLPPLMVYVAAGNPYVVFGITLDNLHNITKGEINSIVE